MKQKRVVIVTGGSAGIGKTIAQQFAQVGEQVFIAGRNTDHLLQASDEIVRQTGTAVGTCVADISQVDACRALIEDIAQKAGRIDVLVNNAAQFDFGEALGFPPERWQHIIATNVSGAFYCAQAFAQHAVQQKSGGCIINISSIAAKLSVPGYFAYAASKAALDNLTQSLALEWAQYGIRVNGVAPGHTNTAGIRKAVHAGELDQRAIESATPLGRLAEPEEISDLVFFLASDKAKYITGQTILIDGGRSVDGRFSRK